MIEDSPWRIESIGTGGTMRATHTNGVQVLLSLGGYATVLECPQNVSEVEAKKLMRELQAWMTETKH